jgi:hypothetical protein
MRIQYDATRAFGARDDGCISSATSAAAARATAALRADGDAPCAPCPFCAAALPLPLAQWGGDCPFCICSTAAVVSSDALDALRLAP